MNAPSRTRTNWLRRCLRFQFSLQTVLWATAVSSVAIWWYLRPPPVVEQLAGGYQLRANQRVIVDPQSGQEQTVRHGPMVVLDGEGRVRCRGRYVAGQATGRWVWYHANGRRQAAGYCQDDCLIGTWVVWNADGHRIQEIHFDAPVKDNTRKRDSAPIAPGYIFGNAVTMPQVVLQVGVRKRGVRQGAQRQWWNDGQLRSQGEYVADQRQGRWRFWNRRGKLIADGSYERGKRQGAWQIATTREGALRQVYYLDGQRSAKWDELLPLLRDQIESDDWSQADRAARRLALVGPAGVDILKQALGAKAPATRGHALRYLAREDKIDADTLAVIQKLSISEDSQTQITALHALYSLDAGQRSKYGDQLLTLGTTDDARQRNWVIQGFVEQAELDLQQLEQALIGPDRQRGQFALLLLCQLLAHCQVGNLHEDPARFDEVDAILMRATESPRRDVATGALEVLDENRYPSNTPFVTY